MNARLHCLRSSDRYCENVLLESAGRTDQADATSGGTCIDPYVDPLHHGSRSVSRPQRWRFLVALGVSFSGWSGGGCNPLGPAGQTITLPIVFDRTGSLTSDGFFRSITDSNAVLIGDQSDNLEVKGFVSVNLNSIPAGATVSRAVLRFESATGSGNAFGDFVFVTVDHVNVVATLAEAFSDNTLNRAIEPFPQFSVADGFVTVELDVTDELNSDLTAGRPISSYRFQFDEAPTLDGQNDLIFIRALAEDAPSQPVAIVTLDP